VPRQQGRFLDPNLAPRMSPRESFAAEVMKKTFGATISFTE
jgi:hypothetical protein